MQQFATASALIAVLAAADSNANAGPSAGSMSKVIGMLMDMKSKVAEEKNAEQIAFSKFAEWCKNGDAELKSEIAKDGEEIETLTASIAELGDVAASLGDAIGELESLVATKEADIVAADKQREKDHAAFLAEEQDYSESVSAVERALETMEKEDYDRPASAAALLQISNRAGMPQKVKSVLSVFVDMMSDKDGLGEMDYSAPEANAYEYQSGSIVSTLKSLNDKFRAKLAETQKEEMNSKHAYDMVIQDLTDTIANAKKDIGEKTKTKAAKLEQQAFDNKQLAQTQVEKAEAEKTLASMDTECSEKRLSYEEKQQLRDEEMEAISKAVEIISAPDVAGSHEKYLSGFAQVQGTSLVQRGTSKVNSEVSNPRRRVREFLAKEGMRLKSKDISMLAEKMAADPFAKVKKMIDGMITRLLEESHADATHEGFCDTEMGKSKITRTKLQEDIDGLDAACEEGKATIMHLTNRIAELSKGVSELETSMSEASEQRADEKKTNEVTVAEAKVAQEKVQAATAVLKDFYARAAGTTALVQTPKKGAALLSTQSGGIKMGSDLWNSLANPDFEGEGGFAVGVESSKVDKGHKAGMQTFGGAYKGNQDGADGVMALLEVILSDFAGLEADTMAAETAAQQSYDAFMIASKKDKAVKEKQIEMDSSDKVAAEARLREDTADLKATQDELLAAERYYDKLVPQCVDPGQSFEERTAARESEIASLKEALKILESNGSIETSA